MCLKKYKHPATIRYVELIPKFANDRKMFLVKNLPFVEEILFPNKMTEQTRTPQTIQPPTGNQLQAVKNLMKGLTCDYKPSVLYNVTYARKKRYLKAKMLDTPYVDPGDCAGDLSAMDEDLGTEISAVRNLFDLSRVIDKKRKGGALSNPRIQRKKQ